MILLTILFKATLVTAFTIGLSFWFKETDKTYVALIYWFAGLFFVFLNTLGVLNGITELITGDYLKLNIVNILISFGVFVYIGLKNFNRL